MKLGNVNRLKLLLALHSQEFGDIYDFNRRYNLNFILMRDEYFEQWVTEFVNNRGFLSPNLEQISQQFQIRLG